MADAPEFAQGTPVLAEAYEFARSAHEREGNTEVAHPVAVAELLSERGFEDEVVAAAILHDVVEDTSVDIDEIARLFGDRIAALVAVMTEDEAITGYRQRKAEHRARVARDGADAAAIYAADKLAKVQKANREGVRLRPRKLGHYQATLTELRGAHPELRFLDELAGELGVLASA